MYRFIPQANLSKIESQIRKNMNIVDGPLLHYVFIHCVCASLFVMLNDLKIEDSEIETHILK